MTASDYQRVEARLVEAEQYLEVGVPSAKETEIQSALRSVIAMVVKERLKAEFREGGNPLITELDSGIQARNTGL